MKAGARQPPARAGHKPRARAAAGAAAQPKDTLAGGALHVLARWRRRFHFFCVWKLRQ